jgi:elongation factor P
MATTADLRKGAVIKFNSDPCLVLESEHRTPGNLRAFYQVKMRNLRSGKLLENRYRSGETIEFLRVEKKEYQFLYKDGDSFVFMDQESYDQVNVEPKNVGEAAAYLKEGAIVGITFNDTEILSVEAPTYVVLRVTQTEPGVKGDSVNNIMKPATLETGATIQVPIFVNEGDLIRVDTSNGGYMERVKE